MKSFDSGLDAGVYDFKENCLKSGFEFCKNHLSDNGNMILIYSDLGYNIGV